MRDILCWDDILSAVKMKQMDNLWMFDRKYPAISGGKMNTQKWFTFIGSTMGHLFYHIFPHHSGRMWRETAQLHVSLSSFLPTRTSTGSMGGDYIHVVRNIIGLWYIYVHITRAIPYWEREKERWVLLRERHGTNIGNKNQSINQCSMWNVPSFSTL